MYILGINLSHDRSACLLKNGKILVGIAEERLDGDKKSPGILQHSGQKVLPFLSLTYCLEVAGIGIDELSLIVVNNALFPMVLDDVRNMIPIKDKQKVICAPQPSHHLIHAYSAYFCSPFKESAILVADVFGSGSLDVNEAESGFYAKGNDLEVVFKNWQKIGAGIPLKEQNFSLTHIYSIITIALGFVLPREKAYPCFYLDEAGKTMALAAYGRAVEDWQNFVDYSNQKKVKTNKFIQWALKRGIVELKNGFLVPLPGLPGRRPGQFEKNLAYKAQQELEKRLIFYANKLYDRTKSKNICFAGGAALNCVAAGKILKHSGFSNIFIQPAASDDGCAIGCCLYGWHRIYGKKKRSVLKNAYLGRPYNEAEIKKTLDERGIFYERLNKAALIRMVANLIAQGKVVGWFQDGSEFGPRALGHRSILADPRNINMKDKINKKVKRREEFRPYAPSILRESLSEYFELDCASPFMLISASVKEEKRRLIPAVLHIDGTARIQTVAKKENSIFYELIKEFKKVTKIPLILNTSFNVRGRPIVETPKDALDIFLYTDMDILALGPYLLKKGRRRPGTNSCL